ncbi:MAG: RICIN domain-containing protein, partial [Candidatus Marithrix sp.]
EDSKQELADSTKKSADEHQQLEQSLEDSKQELADSTKKSADEHQQLEQSLEDSKQELADSAKKSADEHQQLEKSLEDSKQELANSTKKLTDERQQLEQDLEASKQELVTVVEKVKAEQQKYQQLEKSVEESKQESASFTNQLNTEQKKCQKLEDSLDNARKKMSELLQQSEKSKSSQFQPEKMYSIKSINNGNFLDIPKGSAKNNTPIGQDAWNGGKNQQWYFQPLGGNDSEYYYIFSAKTKKCLGVSSSDDKEGVLNQYQCYGTDNQKWKLIKISDSSFAIQCKQNDLMLEVSKKTTKIIQQKSSDNDSQYWELTEL